MINCNDRKPFSELGDLKPNSTFEYMGHWWLIPNMSEVDPSYSAVCEKDVLCINLSSGIAEWLAYGVWVSKIELKAELK